MQPIEQAVHQFFIDNFFIEEGSGELSDDDSFLESGILDSMGVLTLVEFVKEKYGVEIEDEELVPENWDSVCRVANFIRAKLGVGTSTAMPQAAHKQGGNGTAKTDNESVECKASVRCQPATPLITEIPQPAKRIRQ